MCFEKRHPHYREVIHDRDGIKDEEASFSASKLEQVPKASDEQRTEERSRSSLRRRSRGCA